jgi:chaperonin cofactor prefoldin
MSAGPRNENEVLQEFQARRERIQVTWSKIMELGAEATEVGTIESSEAARGWASARCQEAAPPNTLWTRGPPALPGQRHFAYVTATFIPLSLLQHQLVMEALQKLDKDRKCFRLVGDVLVERTVGETVPAVLKNRDNLKSTIESFQKQLEIQKKELAEFQEKYKIRVSTERRGRIGVWGLWVWTAVCTVPSTGAVLPPRRI